MNYPPLPLVDACLTAIKVWPHRPKCPRCKLRRPTARQPHTLLSTTLPPTMPAKCKEREKILATGTADIPGIPVLAIRGYLCFRCFGPGPSDKILKCGGCKRAGYCSKECQKLDWSLGHKKQCKILQDINRFEEERYREKRTWTEYSRSLLHIVRGMRDSYHDEENLHYVVQAQAYCVTCRRSAVQLSTRGIALKACAHCRLVFSCADCPSPPAHPDSVCVAYQNYANVERFRISFFEDTGKASPTTCTQFPRTERKLLAGSPGWFDYFVNISDKPQIQRAIKSDFSGLTDATIRLGHAEELEIEERRRMFLLCATDTLTMPLTIVSALEDISFDKPDLIVHLLGATGREFLALSNFEEILHLVPNLKSLHVTGVGPTAFRMDAGQTSPLSRTMNVECCPICTSEGRSRSVASYHGLYHDLAKTTGYTKPDLFVLFNSGWVDGDDAESDWRPTIKLLIESNIPALFTTYNADEATNEKMKMRQLGGRFLVEPEKNKWSGLVPMPEFLDVEFEMWAQNSHRYVIKGRV